MKFAYIVGSINPDNYYTKGISNILAVYLDKNLAEKRLTDHKRASHLYEEHCKFRAMYTKVEKPSLPKKPLDKNNKNSINAYNDCQKRIDEWESKQKENETMIAKHLDFLLREENDYVKFMVRSQSSLLMVQLMIEEKPLIEE